MRSFVVLALVLGSRATAVAQPSTLAERGFPGSTLVTSDGKTAIYRLGERGSMYYFAVVRHLAPNEAIIDYVDATNRFGSAVATYGPEAKARFTSLIQPALGSPRSYVVTVTVYHYAVGVALKAVPDHPLRDSETRHFATGTAIEPPISKEVWTGERRNSTMPFAWTGDGGEPAQARAFNTLAQVGAVQQRAEVRVAATARYRDSVLQAEAAMLEARHAGSQRREAERREAITKAGLEYRSPEQWSRFRLGPELRAVFDGAWPGAAREWEFGNIYWRTISAYSTRCRRLIPRGSPMEITKRFETDEFGRERSLGAPDTVFIPVAFFPPFQWWDRKAPGALPLMPPGFEPTDVDGVIATLGNMATNPSGALAATALLARVHAALREDLPLLFEGGCESAALVQFMDNMRRLALRQPTLQAARAPQSIPAVADLPLSVGGACRRNDAERRSSSPTGWCDCMDRAAAATMTLGERWLAMDDYPRFFDEALGIRNGADGRPVAARVALVNACMK